MVEDLVVVLKNLVESNPSPPFMIRLNAIHCAFKTLDGPGEQLEADPTVFLHSLHCLLSDTELTENFDRWDIILQCIDIGIVKKRISQIKIVKSVVSLLFLHCTSVEVEVMLTILGVIHAILLRYPRSRESLAAISTSLPVEDDDRVQDFAMDGLLAADSKSGGQGDALASYRDTSWCLNLLTKSLDPRIKAVIAKMTSTQIMPIPYKLSAPLNIGFSCDRIESAFAAVEKKASVISRRNNISPVLTAFTQSKKNNLKQSRGGKGKKK